MVNELKYKHICHTILYKNKNMLSNTVKKIIIKSLSEIGIRYIFEYNEKKTYHAKNAPSANNNIMLIIPTQ